ncbi:SDR family oxidoreductase [Pseudonocardia xinjiangensis]|uniref:SDR family oxidoreductase n=1 Tax=Pseudonocardia xinjiangensis TaxID=75289 RepID=A0ABX1RIT3_9PSEU|nr:SDR family oxidoreductase [Pseudonocardia xinjiangensis]NMH79010.1 SDR family oxidoreductase [Pseudonocardia xinjiangensis]
MPSVLITGASKGIGRATAAEFAARGYRVIATARDPRTLEDLDVAQRLRLDVTDQASVDEAVVAAGEVDVLVSNAGVIFVGAVEASPVAEIERLFAQNTSGAIRVAQAVLPQMRERKNGRLLFLSSVVGRIVLSGDAAYAASKWALEALGEALAIETAPFGIHTTLLEPGSVSSGALDDPLAYRLPDDPYAGALTTDHMDLSYSLTPEEVARAVADAAELDAPPLRLPIGAAATALLAARKAAPENVAFVPGS